MASPRRQEQIPAWPWSLAAAILWLAAAGLAVALAGYHPGDPTPTGPAGPARNWLGLPGAWTAALLYGAFGLAAWLVVLLLVLAGAYLWREHRAAALAWLAGGGLWALAGASGWLGGLSVHLYHGALPAGGAGGKALAAALAAWPGSPWDRLLPLAVGVAGLGVVAWAAWPVLADLPEMLAMPGLPRRESPTPEPEEPAAAPPEPPPAAEPTSAPEPAPPASQEEPGPRILSRRTAPPPVETPAGPVPRLGGLYHPPPLELLQEPVDQRPPDQAETLRHNSRLLEEKLADFGVKGRVVEVAPGPVVTVYEFKPAPGVKISKVAGLADDLALNLRATSIRIVAPIPGKAAIGIEIPNPSRETVFLRELLASPAYQQSPSPITIALGKDILGLPVVEDLGGMPHLLIAGATGSGKSVFINCLVLSLLYKTGPEQVRLLMVDPKRIELSTYDRIPHLLHPIITDPAQAAAALRWAVGEMERRYELLAWMGVRNIAGFNRRLAQGKLPPPPQDRDLGEIGHLPYLVIIIDELADLMMAASKEVETLITRLAQMARAAGIHLVLATQRPSVDVITGLIKANFPARISFKVTSRVDSRTILDTQGAEHLLGMGDMLLSRPGHSGLVRLHGALVTDGEIQRVVDYVRTQGQPRYDQSVVQSVDEGGDTPEEEDQPDELYPQAVALVKQSGQASISYLQRRLRVGYNRAARMIERMEREGIVGPSDGSRPREVLIRE